jgi:hypothetical protein
VLLDELAVLEVLSSNYQRAHSGPLVPGRALGIFNTVLEDEESVEQLALDGVRVAADDCKHTSHYVFPVKIFPHVVDELPQFKHEHLPVELTPAAEGFVCLLCKRIIFETGRTIVEKQLHKLFILLLVVH